MSEPLFQVGGRVMSADQFKASAAKARPKAARDAPPASFKGYVVEGHPPGLRDAAKQKAERDRERWDETQWLRDTKPRRVRSKPYEIESAAAECARLAELAGWTHVRVRADQQGEAQALAW